MIEPIAIGIVRSLAINGEAMISVDFDLQGPRGDVHTGFSRQLSGHDGEYLQTSDLKKGRTVFNTRSWTGLSSEEKGEIEQSLAWCAIPPGCLLENITISGIPNFSQLEPTSRLVFPSHGMGLNQPSSQCGKRMVHAIPSVPVSRHCTRIV
jgi:hypothetical protein